MNKIVFVVNIWRVHSGVPAGMRQRKQWCGRRQFSLRQHKTPGAMAYQRLGRGVENTTARRFFLRHPMLL